MLTDLHDLKSDKKKKLKSKLGAFVWIINISSYIMIYMSISPHLIKNYELFMLLEKIRKLNFSN